MRTLNKHVPSQGGDDGDEETTNLIFVPGSVEVDGRETIDLASFQFIERPVYPIWRQFVALVED